MQDMNSVFVIGRLTNNAEWDANITGKLNFCMAYNTTKKEGDSYKDEGNFLNLSLWGKIASSIAPRMIKGTQIAILGHLKQNRWTNKEGKQQSKLEVIVDSIQLLGSSKKSDGTAATVNALQNAGLVQEDSNAFPEDMFF